MPDSIEITACGGYAIVRPGAPYRTMRASALHAVYAARASQLHVQ